MVMSANCRAQIPWGKLIEIAGTIISTASTLASNMNSTHTKDLNKGIELCEINDYKRALDFLTLVNEDDYDAVRVEAFFYRGICYMGLEEYDIAIKLFDKAINFETTFFTFEKDKIKEFQEEMQLLKEIAYAMALDSPNSDNFIKGMNNIIALRHIINNTKSKDPFNIDEKEENYCTKAFVFFSKVSQNDKTLLRVMAYKYMGLISFRNIFVMKNPSEEKRLKKIEETFRYMTQITNITTSQYDKYRDEIIKCQNDVKKFLNFERL